MDSSSIRLTTVQRSVHITNYYHEHSGGVKASYDKLLAAADRKGRNITLIVPGRTDRIERIGRFGKIYFVASEPSPFFDRRYRLMLPWQFLRPGTPIRRILLDERPEMIEIYDNYALTFLAGMTRMGYFKKLGNPMFVYFTGERFDTIFKSFVIGGRIGKWFSRRLMGNYNLPMFDYYIANSQFVAEELFESVKRESNPKRWEWFFRSCWKLLKARPGSFEDRVGICPRGVNNEFFSPSHRSEKNRKKICAKAGVPESATLIFSATRLSQEKNIELLPDILSELLRCQDRDFRLLVAGSGPKAEWLQDRAEQRFPGKMIVLGQLEKGELAEYYANTDVFIHPNPREPFGNVGLEAMASGAAVVVPNSGGILEYADQTNAWTVDSTAAAFAEAIIEASSDNELKGLRIRGAIETANRNSEFAAIDHLLATYDRMYRDFLAFGSEKSTPAGLIAGEHSFESIRSSK